jgi:hypothetical protein
MKRVISYIGVLTFLLVSSSVQAKKIDTNLQHIGQYVLGTEYDAMKGLAGFKLDEKRSEPDKGIVSAKIIDRSVSNTPTIQRFTFKNGILIRVSIIFHPPQTWTEEAVKNWLVRQWGDPGEKELADGEQHYLWRAPKSLGVILPADGGRWMASLMSLE